MLCVQQQKQFLSKKEIFSDLRSDQEHLIFLIN